MKPSVMCGSSPWPHSRITWEALKTREAQTIPRAIIAGALGVDPGIRIFFFNSPCDSNVQPLLRITALSFVCMALSGH